MSGMTDRFTSNAIELACHIARPSGDVEDGPGVILCHGFPIGPLDLFAKGGFLSWSSYKNIGGSTTDRSGSNALYGGGVGLRIGKIGIRSEYERVDVSDLKRVETYSMSVIIQF